MSVDYYATKNHYTNMYRDMQKALTQWAKAYERAGNSNRTRKTSKRPRDVDLYNFIKSSGLLGPDHWSDPT